MGKLIFVLRWILGTGAGWMGGLILWFAVMWLGRDFIPALRLLPFRVLSVWQTLVYVLATALLCGCIAFGQWQSAMSNKPPKWAWVFAGTVGGALLLIAFAIVSLIAPPVFAAPQRYSTEITFTVADSWFAGVLLIGAAVGLCIGLPQTLILRRYTRGTGLWLLTSIAACILAGTLFVAVFKYVGNNWLAQVLATAVLPLAYGLVTGASMLSFVDDRPLNTDHNLPSDVLA
jgi:hypothetical protein